MKKLLSTTCAMIVGTTLAYSQGNIILSSTGAMISTNGATIGQGTGPMRETANSYYIEVLDMQQTAWNALSTLQQAQAYNLIANPSAVALWTDSGVSGVNNTLHFGGIQGTPAGGLAAANWPSPGTSSSYGGGGQTPDYYTIVAWSSNEGAGWSTVVNELNASQTWNVMGAGSWFGQSPVAFNYSGGGSSSTPPIAVSLWAGSAATGLAGSGGLTGFAMLPIPEPSTMVLAGLGGLSLLLFRRRH